MTAYAILIAFLPAAGEADALAEALREGSRAMRTSPGCELHLVLRATDGSGTIWVAEVWESENAHDAAVATATARAVTDRVMGLVSGVDRRIVAAVPA